ncbi:hypothetical protein BDK92_0998 [Micromonospora pisi]|uniref:Uncharacterized protein n=1 Tax=Micromonospora pisi TaxID=589240 RepID=A0A495JD24_9ACTN|nr:hypothetical protein [Micromonospora pisi]RKR86733.1 hypothetical protein BDK92_0998 [Micromonospora pisi]
MTQAVDASSDQLAAFHQLLLRMSGRLPDELIAACRRWLAEGEFVEIAQAVVFAVLAGRVPMTDTDALLLADTLTDAGEDSDALAEIERAVVDPQPLYGLAPVSPQELADHGDTVPYSIDLTVPYDGPGAADETDRAAVAAVRAQRDEGAPLRALWRAWRFPAIDTQWPPPRRIYLLQADNEAVLPARAAALQHALELAGESDPQVEAFCDADELPAYQRTALGFSTLLWTAAPAVAPLVARVYDTFDPERGPGFDSAHPLLEGEERDRVLSYLAEGVPLLITPSRSQDVVDPAAGEVVPTGFFTDGRWIWTEAVAYYLRVHRLAPDPDMLDAIRAHDYLPPDVDTVGLHRALSTLYAPLTEPAGSADENGDDATVPD